MSNCSQFRAILPVYNESSRIRNTLQYYAERLDHIDVIDNCSIDNTAVIASQFPGISLVQKKNSGTTEDPNWFSWLFSALPSEYYLFLSCSERLSDIYLERIKSFISDDIDLLYVNRYSLTDGQDTSLVFGSIFVALGLKRFTHEVCRFAKRSAIEPSLIKIHDNFVSFRDQRRTVIDLSPDMAMTHLRNGNVQYQLVKNIDYSKLEAEHTPSLSSGLIARRIFREALLMFILAARGRLNPISKNELICRIILHLQVYVIRKSCNAGSEASPQLETEENGKS